MIRATFEPTFDGWRAAARRLLDAGVAPDTVLWEPGGADQSTLDGFAADAPPPPEESAPSARFRVPRRFFELAQAAACHADGERWALLYRVLWRVTHGEPHLLDVAVDPAVHRLLRMEKAVRREVHKMHAFVRFKEVVDEEGAARYVAWYEPAHPVVERAIPFFAERFASMRWSILTPLGCAHWDGETLDLTPPLPRSAAPADDELEPLWRTYYRSTFNPARVRTRAMLAEMPVRYWKNLPEAHQIGELVREAPQRVRGMIERHGLPAELQRPPRRPTED
jgi:DNA polymerase